MALLVAACDAVPSSTSDPLDGPITTSPVTTSPVTTSAVTTGPVANDLAGFSRVDIALGGTVWTVALADTPLLRSQGLMGVTELVGVDGMLFVFEQTISASFWMKDTLIPLDIAFFDEQGTLVDTFTMTPCDSDPCQTYPAAGPFRYALETTVGGFEGLDLVLSTEY